MRSHPNVNAKHLIGLFCTSSQSGFIYKLASESYYELLNFAVDGLILLLYVKIAICSRPLQFAKAISRSILRDNIARNSQDIYANIICVFPRNLWLFREDSTIKQLPETEALIIETRAYLRKAWLVRKHVNQIEKFRSRTRTSKTTWKWRVVPMYGYATPFSRRLWRPRSKSVYYL